MIDAYISTKTPHSFEIRIISQSADDIQITINQKNETNLKPSHTEYDMYFYKHLISHLIPNSLYTISISQQKESECVLQVKTLDKPKGQRVSRFGILTDLHISSLSFNRTDSYKRLYSKALILAEKYIKRLEEQGAEFIILPGDTLDPADKQNLEIFSHLKAKSAIPLYPVLGNHEAWGNGKADKFNKLFCPDPRGYYSIIIEDFQLIMLSTPHQNSLSPGSSQAQWLLSRIEATPKDQSLLLFLHFSFLLHPCVQGYKNDNMQVLDNADFWLKEFERYKQIKAIFAGHKNVPSLVKHGSINHFLSPQLIQAPCSYDLIELYEDGLIRSIYEIDEQHWLWKSRQAFTPKDWDERFGEETSRNLTIHF